MLITFFVLKLTLEAIVGECNRLAIAEEKKEQAKFLKSKLFQIQADYESGSIDEKNYKEKEAEILKELYEIVGQIKPPTNSIEINL